MSESNNHVKTGLIGTYKNGNYNVMIMSDGTKIRYNDLDSLEPDFPESIDIKITDCCDMGCPYCHEDSKPNGKHADILNLKFFDSLRPYTELAIGGGNPLSHPDILEFLEKCKEHKLVANMTVNQEHFLRYYDKVKQLCDNGLIYGLGISLTKVTDELIEKVTSISNAVLHVINGVVEIDELAKLYDRNIAILILGYKTFRRGSLYLSSCYEDVNNRRLAMYDALPTISEHFRVVSFDNLAINQLEVSRLVSPEQWIRMYMGDDGQFTMYIDAVKEEFSVSSTSTERYPIKESIDEMFSDVKRIVKSE